MAPQRPKGAGALETDTALSPAPVPPGKEALFAALDLGTNSCRMLIATPVGRGFDVVDSFSKSVQLGTGLEKSGRLSRSSMNRRMADTIRERSSNVRTVSGFVYMSTYR